MKFKTPILIYATARGNLCHSQCSGLVDIGEKPRTELCCSIFAHRILESVNEGILRDKKCLSAQRAAIKAMKLI